MTPASARRDREPRLRASGPCFYLQCDRARRQRRRARRRQENAALDRALAAVRARVEQRSQAAAPAVRDIMAAHLELLDDPQLLVMPRARRSAPARARHSPGATVCARAPRRWRPPVMRASPSASTICADLERQVLRALVGGYSSASTSRPAPFCVARDLTPSQLDRHRQPASSPASRSRPGPDLARGDPRRHAGRAHAGALWAADAGARCRTAP